MHFLFLFLLICSTTTNQLDFYPTQGYESNGNYFFAGDTIFVQEASGKANMFLEEKGAKYRSIKRITYPLIFKSFKTSYQKQLEPGEYVILTILRKKTFKKEAFALIEFNDNHFIIGLNSSIKSNEVVYKNEGDREQLFLQNQTKSHTAFYFGNKVD